MSLHGFLSPYLPGADLDPIRLHCVQIFSMHRQNWRVTKERACNNHNKAIITINMFCKKKRSNLKHSISTILHQIPFPLFFHLSVTIESWMNVSHYYSLVFQPSSILPLHLKAGAPTVNRCWYTLSMEISERGRAKSWYGEWKKERKKTVQCEVLVRESTFPFIGLLLKRDNRISVRTVALQ